jgi:adenylylsulfate kinase
VDKGALVLILWITGQSGSGKTTLAKYFLQRIKAVHLDGDEMRKAISRDLGLEKGDRYEHNLRVARLAKELEDQGFNVIVSLISPYRDLRREIEEITGCSYIFLRGGKVHQDYPYEEPDDVLTLEAWNFGD